MAMLCVFAVHLVSRTDLLEFLDMGMASALFVVLTIASTPNMVGQWGSRPARRAPVRLGSPSRRIPSAGPALGPAFVSGRWSRWARWRWAQMNDQIRPSALPCPPSEPIGADQEEAESWVAVPAVS